MHIAIILTALPLIQDGWVHRELPSVCRPTVPAQAPCELLDADHLPFPRRLPKAQEASPAPIPVALLMQLLEGDLPQGAPSPQIRVSGETLLIQDDPEGLRAVDEVLRGLSLLEDQLRIAWQVELSTGDGQTLSWSGSSRSGERIPLGQRRVVTYLGTHDVNVTSDAGIATPQTHRALLGPTAHLTFSKLKGGGHLIEGCLDVADLVSLKELDPETPDLGMLQLPEVATAQVRFAGRDQAVVSLKGPRVPSGGLTLEITTAPGSSSAAPPNLGPWLLHDLAALTRLAPRPSPVEVGKLGSQPSPTKNQPSAAQDVGILASLLNDGRLDGPRPIYAGSLLLVQRESSAATHVHALLAALEEDLRPGTVLLSMEGLQATFPVISGREARLVIGIENRRACEVDALLAPSIWMPILQVERTFDGLVLDGAVSGERFVGSIWESTSLILEGSSEAHNGVASLQRLERTRRGCSVDLLPTAKQGSEVLAERAGTQAVRIHFSLD